MLVTKELEQRFNKVWDQADVKDPIVIAKFFHPFHSWTRYAVSYDPVDRIFYGYVDSEFWERWSFSLDEFRGININWLPMERDKFWKEIPFSEVKLCFTY
jgi:hypothetical protein